MLRIELYHVCVVLMFSMFYISYMQQQKHLDKLTKEITNLKTELKTKGDADTFDKRLKEVEESLLGHQDTLNNTVKNITLNITFLEKSLMDAEKTFKHFQTELSKKDEKIKEIEEGLMETQNKLRNADEKLKVLDKMRVNVGNKLNYLKADKLKQEEVNKELVSNVKYLLEGMRQAGESFEEVKKVIQDQYDINESTEKRFGNLEHTISDLERNYRKSSGVERRILRVTFVFVVDKFVNYVFGGVAGLLSSLTQSLLN